MNAQPDPVPATDPRSDPERPPLDRAANDASAGLPASAPASGRLACITGGTSGIGAALVVAFLKAGDRVCACGRTPERVARLRAAWPDAVTDGRLTVLAGDVTDAAFRARLFAHLDDLAGHDGGLDLLVNNAAILRGGGDLDETLADWRLTLETNLIAPFALIQAAVPLLERSPAPAIINISSVCAQQPFDTCTSSAYSVSKAGLDLLTRRLARSLAPRRIRVVGLAPGVVASAMWDGATALMARTVARRHLLGRRGIDADEIAAAALFLASPAAASVTGIILAVDAGYGLG